MVRPETGVMRFGDDWTGVFLRGDYAGPLALVLGQVLLDIEQGRKPSVLFVKMLEGLAETLAECGDPGGAARPVAQMAVLASGKDSCPSG